MVMVFEGILKQLPTQEQVDEFLSEQVDPVLAERSDLLGGDGDVRI